MKSIAFVIPYFGKLPAYMPAWLNSCRQNPTVDFFLFTDDNTEYVYPKNVHVIQMTLAGVKQLMQAQFDFPISLERPYKLCDYKPVYGAAFAKWIGTYDFWGHCDVDLVWGNIRHYFSEDKLEKFDRVLWQGHCSIYRNNDKVNNYYRTLNPMGCIDWREVYSSDKGFSFDEYAEHNGGGLALIMERNGVPMYKEWVFADICVGLSRFQISYSENSYYSDDSDSYASFFERTPDGLLLHYRKNGEIRNKEFMYAHFQKRALCAPTTIVGKDNYIILPPGKVKAVGGKLTDKEIKKYLNRNARRGVVSAFWESLIVTKFWRRVLNKISRMLKNR